MIKTNKIRYTFLMSLFCLSVINAQVEYDSEDILHGTNAGLKNRWFTKFSGKIVHGNVYTNYGNSRICSMVLCGQGSSMASGKNGTTQA